MKIIVIPEETTPAQFTEQTFNLMIALVQVISIYLMRQTEHHDIAASLLTAYFRSVAEIAGQDSLFENLEEELDETGRQLLQLIRTGLSFEEAKAVLSGKGN